MTKRAIYFDMDGTIANLYGVENWLEYLMNERTKPYREAKPLIDMKALSKEIKRVQKLGYIVGIISWLSKGAAETYNVRVAETKKRWLDRHIGAVEWDAVHIVEYGTPKHNIGCGILFDDEEHNRIEWAKVNNNIAFGVENILDIMRTIV